MAFKKFFCVICKSNANLLFCKLLCYFLSCYAWPEVETQYPIREDICMTFHCQHVLFLSNNITINNSNFSRKNPLDRFDVNNGRQKAA